VGEVEPAMGRRGVALAAPAPPRTELKLCPYGLDRQARPAGGVSLASFRLCNWTVEAADAKIRARPFRKGDPLAHSRSAEKRYRQSLDRQVRNRSVRSAARTYVSKALGLIKGGSLPEAEAAVREAVSVLDQAQKKGVIHANNAARHKSRLMARYNAALVAAAVAQAEAEARAQAEAPPVEEPVEPRRRGRLIRRAAEKPPAKAAKPAAAAKGRGKPSKAPAKKEGKAKAKKKEEKAKKK
jgi:small subunit ribosomal protein S20